MSNTLKFPIKYEYAKVTPGDYVTTESANFSYRYSNSQNRVIKVLADTSKATDMNNMFYNCTRLTSIPQLDTSNVTNMRAMFRYCNSLLSIPQLDTSNVTDMHYMFSDCNNLTTIPQLNTSNVTDIGEMFYNCRSMISIPLLDCQNVKSMSNFFGYSNLDKLTNIAGFKDLGKQSSVSGINSYFLDYAPNLTHESLMNVINNLYDRKTNGLSNISIKLGTTNLNKLTDEEKAIAINKGWNLS